MSITTKTRVMLWGRSAHRCDFPECRRELIVGEFGTDDASLIGEICHIVADKSDGPRGASSLTSEERDIDEWNPELYKKLLRRFTFHVVLVMDLMLELTRAANYICDRVREFVDPMFRMKEGAVLAESGPYLDFSFVQHRVEYGDSERVLQPYPGLTEFVIERKQRDSHFGEGADPDDPEFRISE